MFVLHKFTKFFHQATIEFNRMIIGRRERATTKDDNNKKKPNLWKTKSTEALNRFWQEQKLILEQKHLPLWKSIKRKFMRRSCMVWENECFRMPLMQFPVRMTNLPLFEAGIATVFDIFEMANMLKTAHSSRIKARNMRANHLIWLSALNSNFHIVVNMQI